MIDGTDDTVGATVGSVGDWVGATLGPVGNCCVGYRAGDTVTERLGDTVGDKLASAGPSETTMAENSQARPKAMARKGRVTNCSSQHWIFEFGAFVIKF